MATRTDDGAPIKTTSTEDMSRTAAIGGAVSDAAGTVRVAAGDAVSRLPDVAATTRSAIEDANRQMRAGSDEMLTMGTVLSFGFALGLLVGGGGRLLVAGALVPAAAMGITLLDRTSRVRRTSSRSLQGG
ncbi:MAG: hypothetical protein ABJC39_02195 [Chloroflexota bacterium]